MKSFKVPDFQERAALAAQARQKALDVLKTKAPVDEATLAERRAAQERREVAEAEKRAVKRAALEQAKADKRARAVEAAASAAAAVKAQPTEAERKAARDARYAARKNRK